MVRGWSLGRVKNFHFSMSFRVALRPTQLPTQWVPGALTQVVKWPWHEADYSPPTSAEVKKTWIYIFNSSYFFKAQYLISSAQGQLYLTLLHMSGTTGIQVNNWGEFHNLHCSLSKVG
jgi:hypothetical protein